MKFSLMQKTDSTDDLFVLKLYYDDETYWDHAVFSAVSKNGNPPGSLLYGGNGSTILQKAFKEDYSLVRVLGTLARNKAEQVDYKNTFY